MPRKTRRSKDKLRYKSGKNNQVEPKIRIKGNCARCKSSGMIVEDYHFFIKRTKCDRCDIWEQRLQALKPK